MSKEMPQTAIKKCMVCGKVIHYSKKYCSRECSYKGRSFPENKRGALIECEACGKTFYVKPSRAKNSRFCSSACWARSEESKEIVSKSTKEVWKNNPRFGELNGNWKGGITPEQRSRLTRKKWKNTRKFILDRDNNVCQKCGSHERDLHVHHKVPWRFGGTDDPENLITLCSNCHPGEEVISVVRVYQGAIDKYCEQCCGSRVEVKNCTVTACTLWPVRPWQGKETTT